jgi:hypothetical protein
LPVVLYGCKTWSLALREEHRLRTLENMVLRRIFRPNEDEIIGGWRKLLNEELHNLRFARYNQNNQVKEDEMGRVCSTLLSESQKETDQ